MEASHDCQENVVKRGVDRPELRYCLMPLIIKPRTFSLLTRAERRRHGASYIVAAFAAFDLADPSRLDGEQALWTMLAKVLPPMVTLDACMPKPRAEMLIGGCLDVPHAGGLVLEAEVAGLRRRLAVFGDRWWANGANGYAATAPGPIAGLLLGPERAFGGPGHRLNPLGRGYDAPTLVGKGAPVALPNIEDPDGLIHAIDDEPAPVRFGPLDVLSPERQALAGTYDQAWAETRSPGLPDDIHPDFFMTAAPEQRFASYLVGDEPYRLRNFAADRPLIEDRLPAVRPRAFVGRGEDSWAEVPLRLDTLWLFAGARRGVLIWHGTTAVADIEGRDVTDVLVAHERMSDEPRPLAHYAEVRRLRRDPEEGPRYAFAESQLVPPRDPAEDARRLAARRALARARSEKMAEAQAFLAGREMDALGIPEALRPPLAAIDDEPLPLPTPEEIADGDFDLAGLLDAIESKTRQIKADLAAAQEKTTPVAEALARMAAPGAGSDGVDALLKAAGPLVGADLAATLDDTLGRPHAPPGLPEGRTVPAELEQALAQPMAAGDWRGAIATALSGAGDDERVEAAYQRFRDAPEQRPLAAARTALEQIQKVPDIPALPESPPAPLPSPPEGASPSVAAMLERLAGEPGLPQPGVSQPGVADTLAAAEARIAEPLPGLRAASTGGTIDALLDALGALGAPAAPDPRSADERLAEARGQTETIGAQIDAAELRLAEGIGRMRLASPTPLYPEQRLTPALAKRFGDRVLADIRAGIDLRGRDLAGVDLAGADLSGLDLTGAFLERANLARARLAGARLVKATLAGARLEEADLSGADLTDANLAGVDGARADLTAARLASSVMQGARLAGARLAGALLSGLSLLEVALDGADLSGARLEEISWLKGTARGASFERATLRQCQFLQTELAGAVMAEAFLDRCAFIQVAAPRLVATDADLRSTVFVGEAQLAGADFSRALASDCSFFGADLTGACFSRAVLSRSTLSDAKLGGARMRLASLDRALLDGADFTAADLIGAHMFEAKLHRTRLHGASLRGANLYGADLMDAVVEGADLTGANLAKTVLALETRHV